MRNFTLLLIIVTLTISCGQRDTTVKEGYGYSIDVIEVDSCEYILYQGYYQGNIVHKENCKYCAKRDLNE